MLPVPMAAALLAAYPTFQDALSGYFTDVLPLILASFAISLFVTALMYMAGSALQSQDLLALGKDNLANLFFSAIIVFMFLALFAIFQQFASAIACGQPCDHLQAAYSSVLMLRSKLMSLYFNLYFYELIFGFLSTLGFSIPLPALGPASLLAFIINLPTISFAPLSGLTPLSNAHTIVVEAVGTALLAVLARQVLLEFVMKYMFVFLVIGAGLRSMWFTRRTGSSILALAGVSYFVYPLAVLLSNYLIFQAYEPANFGVIPTSIGFCEDSTTLGSLSVMFASERSNLYNASIPKSETKWYMFWNTLVDGANYVGESASMMLKVLWSFNMNLAYLLILSPMAFSTFLDFLFIEIQTQVQFLVLVFVCFVTEIIITITMYRGVAMLIEGESEIFGISKLM